MAKLQYRYDVEVYSTKGKNRRQLKPIARNVTGAALKDIRRKIKNRGAVNNREVRIYKTIIRPNGKSSRFIHDTITFGVRQDVEKTLGQNLHYHNIEVDYEYDTNCYASGCDSICRCGRIEGARVEEISDGIVDDMLGDILKAVKWFRTKVNEDVLKYCLERVLEYRGHFRSPECYYVSTCGGYYGEEIEGVYYEVDSQLVNDVCAVIEAPSSIEALKHTLEVEYDNQLPEAKKYKHCKIRTVKVNSLVPPNGYHIGKLDKDFVKRYKDFDYKDRPIGIYKKAGKKYEIIDGYHRYRAATINEPEKVKIIEITRSR